jgi:glycosyltransferase involved in cell wall biosynthesis
MKILFLSRWFPYPTNNGSKLRIYNLLRGLAAQHEITLVTFADQPEIDLEPAELTSICQEIRVVPWQPYNPHSLRARLGFLSMTPRSAVDTYSLAMQRTIEEMITSGQFDVVIASQWEMAGYSNCFQEVPALFEEVEVGLLYEQYAQATLLRERVRYGLSWAKHRHYLARLLKDFQACTVVSEKEKQLLTSIKPDNRIVETIPNCINLDDYYKNTSTLNPNALIFTGSFRYHANYEAMVWFLEEVYPLIFAQIPDVQLTITGDHANKPLPMQKNVSLVGYVDDIQSLIVTSSVSIVPLLVGGGTRLKILEAMALCTPVVSTTKGAEGLNVQHENNIFIADAPEAFAEAVVSLLQKPELRKSIAENAYSLVSEHYNWPIVMPRFVNLVEKLAGIKTA